VNQVKMYDMIDEIPIFDMKLGRGLTYELKKAPRQKSLFLVK